MKIVILNWRSIKDPLAGGAEQATYEYALRWIKKHQDKVLWISASYNQNIKEEEIDGIKFVYLGEKLERDSVLNLIFSFPKFLFETYKYYKENIEGKYDVIIDQVHGFPFFTPFYAREIVIVFIHEIAGDIWDKMYSFPINVLGKFFEHHIFSRIYKNNTFVTVSESTKNSLFQVGVEKNRVKVVLGNGISIKNIEKPAKKFDEFTIIYLNRIVKMKGPERAIEIFAQVKSHIQDAKMIMIGRGEESYISELKEKAKNLNVLKDIDFKGFVSLNEKINYLQKSHVLINTSFKEGWGLVNLEANSQGTPVVAFDVDGCRESVKDGVSGFIAKDEAEFVEKILKLKETNLEASSIEFSKQFNYDDKAEEFWAVLNEK